MTDLRELYQEVILDHGKHPRHFGELDDATSCAEGFNPLCGDKIKVFMCLEGERIKRCAFTGTACAICTASASLMAEAVSGTMECDARALGDRFRKAMTEPNGSADASDNALGKLCVLSGVRKYPMRVKCATLPWHTLLAALNSEGGVVSTE